MFTSDSIQRTCEVQGLGGKLHDFDDSKLLRVLILCQDSPPSSDLYSAVGSVPTYTLFSCSIRLAETEVTSLLGMESFAILSQLCPASSLFHSPSPKVPQYTRFEFRWSNVTDSG